MKWVKVSQPSNDTIEDKSPEFRTLASSITSACLLVNTLISTELQSALLW